MDQKITKNNQAENAVSKKQKLIISMIFLMAGLIIFAVAYYLKNNSVLFGINNQAILDYFISLRTEKLTSVFTLITNLISPTNIVITVGLATIFWILIKKETVRPMLFGGAIFTAATLSYLLKDLFKNPRPPQISMISPFELDYSFPSGHTICAVVLVLVLGYLIYSRAYNTSRVISWLSMSIITITIMAVSRLYLGYHWMSDIFASIGLGLVIVGLTIVVDILIENSSNKQLK